MSLLPSGWLPERPLEDEITNVQVDVLSARCAADRLRLRRAMPQIAFATSEEMLEKILADLNSVLDFVEDLERVKQGQTGHRA